MQYSVLLVQRRRTGGGGQLGEGDDEQRDEVLGDLVVGHVVELEDAHVVAVAGDILHEEERVHHTLLVFGRAVAAHQPLPEQLHQVRPVALRERVPAVTHL